MPNPILKLSCTVMKAEHTSVCGISFLLVGKNMQFLDPALVLFAF